jgi:hypothetical protein
MSEARLKINRRIGREQPPPNTNYIKTDTTRPKSNPNGLEINGIQIEPILQATFLKWFYCTLRLSYLANYSQIVLEMETEFKQWGKTEVLSEIETIQFMLNDMSSFDTSILVSSVHSFSVELNDTCMADFIQQSEQTEPTNNPSISTPDKSKPLDEALFVTPYLQKVFTCVLDYFTQGDEKAFLTTLEELNEMEATEMETFETLRKQAESAYQSTRRVGNWLTDEFTWYVLIQIVIWVINGYTMYTTNKKEINKVVLTSRFTLFLLLIIGVLFYWTQSGNYVIEIWNDRKMEIYVDEFKKACTMGQNSIENYLTYYLAFLKLLVVHAKNGKLPGNNYKTYVHTMTLSFFNMYFAVESVALDRILKIPTSLLPFNEEDDIGKRYIFTLEKSLRSLWRITYNNWLQYKQDRPDDQKWTQMLRILNPSYFVNSITLEGIELALQQSIRMLPAFYTFMNDRGCVFDFVSNYMNNYYLQTFAIISCYIVYNMTAKKTHRIPLYTNSPELILGHPVYVWINEKFTGNSYTSQSYNKQLKFIGSFKTTEDFVTFFNQSVPSNNKYRKLDADDYLLKKHEEKLLFHESNPFSFYSLATQFYVCITGKLFNCVFFFTGTVDQTNDTLLKYTVEPNTKEIPPKEKNKKELALFNFHVGHFDSSQKTDLKTTLTDLKTRKTDNDYKTFYIYITYSKETPAYENDSLSQDEDSFTRCLFYMLHHHFVQTHKQPMFQLEPQSSWHSWIFGKERKIDYSTFKSIYTLWETSLNLGSDTNKKIVRAITSSFTPERPPNGTPTPHTIQTMLTPAQPSPSESFYTCSFECFLSQLPSKQVLISKDNIENTLTIIQKIVTSLSDDSKKEERLYKVDTPTPKKRPNRIFYI